MMSLIDVLIMKVDKALRSLVPPPKRVAIRPSPAKGMTEELLTSSAKKHVAGLMRVNHAGEVCAQALYQAQALAAKSLQMKEQMAEAAAEEIDHLAWCEERLRELDSHPSILNPFWYMGSFCLGLVAGAAGDKISLGFVAETERQVSLHLQKHIEKIPREDQKTKSILKKMQEEEDRHAIVALEAGAIQLPYVMKQCMSALSKLMTKSSYYL